MSWNIQNIFVFMVNISMYVVPSLAVDNRGEVAPCSFGPPFATIQQSSCCCKINPFRIKEMKKGNRASKVTWQSNMYALSTEGRLSNADWLLLNCRKILFCLWFCKQSKLQPLGIQDAFFFLHSCCIICGLWDWFVTTFFGFQTSFRPVITRPSSLGCLCDGSEEALCTGVCGCGQLEDSNH